MTPSNLYCPDTLSQPTYYIPITCLHHLCVPSFTHSTTPQSTSSAVQPMPDLPLVVSPRHPPPQSCPHALFTWSCSAFAYLLPEPELTFRLLWIILFFFLQRHMSHLYVGRCASHGMQAMQMAGSAEQAAVQRITPLVWLISQLQATALWYTHICMRTLNNVKHHVCCVCCTIF